MATTKKWSYLHMPKTGGTFLNRVMRKLCEEGHLPYNFDEAFINRKEMYRDLSEQEKSGFVFGTIRSPWSWHVSHWNWFSEPRAEGDRRAITPGTPFKDWLLSDKLIMVREITKHYGDCPNMVRLEFVSGDLICALLEAGEILSEEAKEVIRTFPAQNVNPKVEDKVELLYDEELKKVVLDNCAPVFDRFYPERNFFVRPCIDSEEQKATGLS